MSVSSYIEKIGNEEVIDIDELNETIKDIVLKENELRKSIDEVIKNISEVFDA